MTSARWFRLEELFQAALDVPPAGRSDFLANACAGDAQIQNEVRSLIEKYEASGSLLSSLTFKSEPTGNEAAQRLSRGEHLARFEILSFLGRGGMGEVYLARDRGLERNVALKVLPLSAREQSGSREPLQFEARAASALNHPNIVTVFDTGEVDGMQFIATEYIEGVTLRTHLRANRLSVTSAIDIAVQIASALSLAHTSGIIHRDIKPENIMLRPDGVAKVLDFGIAKRNEERSFMSGCITTEHVYQTQAGVLIGSLPYMSPEQARCQPVDARSDIFSFGALLHEMLTGSRAFAGGSPLLVLLEILYFEPAPARKLNKSVPVKLDRLVARCLAKNAEARPKSMDELVAELIRIKENARTSGTKRLLAFIATVIALTLILLFSSRLRDRNIVPTIAVLPIQSLSNDPAQEYFSDGVTDALITEVARLPGVRVLSRTSVLRFKNTKLSIQDVASQLHVRYVLEGTLFRQDKRVRLTTQLIEARPERHLWAETYDRDARDLLTVESEVSAAIARQIQLRLSPKEEKRLRTPRPLDPLAQDTFLRARYFLMQRSPESLNRAIVYYKATIEREPAYASAYAGLADAYIVTAGNGWLPSAEVLSQAKTAARKALRLDPELAEGHSALGSIADTFDWDWKTARREFETAIRLNANDSTTHQWYGEMLALSGDFDRGIAETKRAVELDPFSPIANASYGSVLYRARMYDAALDQFQKTVELFPAHLPAYVHLGMTYMALNRLAEAISTLEKANSLSDGAPPILSLVGCSYARAGQRDKAAAILAKLVRFSETSPVLPATVYIGLGNRSKALDLLEKGFRLKSNFMDELRVDPLFDPLRNERRFKDLIAKFRALE